MFLEAEGVRVDVYDPLATTKNLPEQLQAMILKEFPNEETYEVVILAVPHKGLIQMGVDKLLNDNSKNAIFFDLKDAMKTPRLTFAFKRWRRA